MELDQVFATFVESIKPSPQWTRQARDTTTKLFNALKTYSKISINRMEEAGGMQKGTSTCLKSDVDVVIYYDDDEQKTSKKEVFFSH